MPVAPSSAETIAYIDSHGGERLHPDFGSPRADGFPYAVVGDRHVLVVDRASCTLFELYRAFFKRKGGALWNADSGVSWNLRSAARRPDWLPRPRDPRQLREHPRRPSRS